MSARAEGWRTLNLENLSPDGLDAVRRDRSRHATQRAIAGLLLLAHRYREAGNRTLADRCEGKASALYDALPSVLTW